MRRRKFDLRQWVLVTPVPGGGAMGGGGGGGVGGGVRRRGRCSSSGASRRATCASRRRVVARLLDDRFAHLCNYSVQKDGEIAAATTAWRTSLGYDDGALTGRRALPAIEENMWPAETLAEHVGLGPHGAGAWATTIAPAMRTLVLSTAAAAAPHLRKVGRVNGSADVMVDEALALWLLGQRAGLPSPPPRDARESRVSPSLSCGMSRAPPPPATPPAAPFRR